LECKTRRGIQNERKDSSNSSGGEHNNNKVDLSQWKYQYICKEFLPQEPAVMCTHI
jgi:hypothetical protein